MATSALLARTQISTQISLAAIWLLGAALAGLVAWWQQQENSVSALRRFASLAQGVETEVLNRMLVYEHGLRGARGAVIGAGGAGITRQTFDAYSESRELEREFPGSRGFGFIRRVPLSEQHRFVADARNDGAPSFRVRHLGPVGKEWWVIQYIDAPQRNEAAIGLDIASETTRRQAAELAMETGLPVMTAPIALVQSDTSVLNSVLVLLAAYDANKPLTTPEERKAATLGWTYTPLELPQVLRGIEGTDGTFTLHLTDIDPSTAPVSLYSSPQPTEKQLTSGALTHTAHLLVFGREWRLTVQAQQPFLRQLNLRRPLDVWLSLLAVWTVAALLWSQRHTARLNRQAIWTQQARLAAVVNGSNDAVVAKTLEGIITDWNPAAERIFGFTAAQAIGQPMTSLVFPPDRVAEEAEILSKIAQGQEVKAFDTVRMHQDQRLMDVTVSVSPVLDANGKTVGAATVMRDISAEKAAQQRILELNAALADQVSERTVREQVLLEQALSSIIVTDESGTVVLFNPVAEKLLGYKAAEVIGTEVMSRFHDSTEVKSRVKQASRMLGRPLGPGEVFLPHVRALVGDRSEWLYVHKDGTRIPVLLTVGALRNSEGHLNGFIGIASDLREQKQLERELTEAISASAAKDMFLATISHEMRTPLNAMIGLSYLLARTRLSEEQQELLAKVQGACKGLLGLINDVLDLSKIEAGEMQLHPVAFELTTVMHDALSLVEANAQAKGLALVLDIAEDLPKYWVGDDGRLHQIITNLLANAVKFTATGSVTLQATALPTSVPGSVRLRISVQDTGIGIAPDVQKRLFTPFVQADSSITRHYGGTGLGLSIVLKLVEMMEGQVGVTSAPGQGSEFWFTVTLPTLEQHTGLTHLPGPVAQEGAEGQRLSGIHVLLVDDSDINREVGSRILTGQGARVTLASNGEEALAALKPEFAHFDIVLMDLQMPIMDGCTAARHIRSDLGIVDLPIVALTAWSMASARTKALDAGMTAFLSKPFDPAAMIGHVERLTRPVAPFHWLETDTSTPADPVLWSRLTRQLQAEHLPWLNRVIAGEHLSIDGLQTKLHKLQGSAGMLGYTALRLAAEKAQKLHTHDHADKIRSQCGAIAGLLQAAVDGVMSGTDSAAPGQSIESTHAPAAVSSHEWLEFQHLIQQHSLEAVDLYHRLRPLLHERLDGNALASMDSAMALLDFSGAHVWLQKHSEAVVPAA